MRITADKTLAVIVDVQERLFPHIAEHEKLERTIPILIEGLKALDVPLIVTEQYPKGLGTTIESVRKALGEWYKPLEKISFSCCGDDQFNLQVARYAPQYVLLAGIETHVCVLQTAIDLLNEGYTPVLVANCVSSRFLEDKEFALRRMEQAGVVLTTYESILFELAQVAGTDTFKRISKLVK